MVSVDQVVISVGLLSAAYVLYKLLVKTTAPQGRVPYKNFHYYGDDNIIFPGVFNVPASKSSINSSDKLQIFHFNNADFQIDNTQFKDDFKYYQL